MWHVRDTDRSSKTHHLPTPGPPQEGEGKGGGEGRREGKKAGKEGEGRGEERKGKKEGQEERKEGKKERRKAREEREERGERLVPEAPQTGASVFPVKGQREPLHEHGCAGISGLELARSQN